ncbi:MAG: hypothetical protein LCH53_06020 [Bacteroidetes bacterium]|nr:hypothetical protein [Bacteroidota bacterium]
MTHAPTLFDPPREASEPEPLPEDATWEQRAHAFLDAHPEVYDAIVRIARQLKARGYARYSIKGVMEIVRYLHEGDTKPDAAEPFKLNNNYSATFARVVMAREDDLQDFFQTRKAGE